MEPNAAFNDLMEANVADEVPVEGNPPADSSLTAQNSGSSGNASVFGSKNQVINEEVTENEVEQFILNNVEV